MHSVFAWPSTESREDCFLKTETFGAQLCYEHGVTLVLCENNSVYSIFDWFYFNDFTVNPFLSLLHTFSGAVLAQLWWACG